MAHVAAWKKDLVNELAQEMVSSPVVAVVDVHGIGGQQIQSMRAGLRGHAKLKMTKNNLILLAIEKAAESKPEIAGLTEAVYGQCAVVSTDINPFKLFAKLESTKTPAAAKPGEIAPFDIVVPKGPTPFGPGPIIGDLQKLGLPAAIDGFRVAQISDLHGKEFGPGSETLAEREILPMIVGMDLRACYEDGVIYKKDVLDIPENYYRDMFATAAFNARALGVAIAFPAKETIVPLLQKAFREALGLSISAAIPTKENIEMLLAKADAQMLAVASASGYTNDAIAARLSNAAAAAPVAAAEAPAAAAEPEEEEEEVSEEEAAAGLSALFG